MRSCGSSRCHHSGYLHFGHLLGFHCQAVEAALRIDCNCREVCMLSATRASFPRRLMHKWISSTAPRTVPFISMPGIIRPDAARHSSTLALCLFSGRHSMSMSILTHNLSSHDERLSQVAAPPDNIEIVAPRVPWCVSHDEPHTQTTIWQWAGMME